MNFSLAAILSSTTGRLLCDIDELKALFDHMTQDDISTHQMLRLAEPVKTELLRQHPQLAEIDTSNVNKDNWPFFLGEQVIAFGFNLWVDPLGTHEHKDPVEEAVEIWGAANVLVASPDYPTREAQEQERRAG